MQWPGLLRRMAAEGHQIASHTWTHPNTSTLSKAQVSNQMAWNEIARSAVLGYFPTYMRPPYAACRAACQTVMGQLGYHIVYYNIDTKDYLNDDASLIQNSKDIWDVAVNEGSPATKSFLEIGHDIHYQSVYNLTGYILTSLKKKGYQAVTVGECLGDAKKNWYRQGKGGT